MRSHGQSPNQKGTRKRLNEKATRKKHKRPPTKEEIRKARKSGQDILREGDAETARILRDVILARAREARDDVFKFFEFVLKEEHSRKPIKLAPHQKVGIAFMLEHQRSCNVWPIGHSKTFIMAGLTLWLLGHDVTARGAVVSATQEQAQKVVGMVRDYIENSAELRLVFPHLRKSQRKGDSWTQTELTIDRPPGIRDPSVKAVGIDGAIAGARLNWIIIDDILSRENTATKEQRDKVHEWVDSSVLSRLDPRGARVCVMNTAWHPDDLVHRMKKAGWAFMRMDVEGGIYVQDDVERLEMGMPPWDHPLINPKPGGGPNDCLIGGYEWMLPSEVTLWPYRMDRAAVERARRSFLPHRFNQLFMGICRDDLSARCKQEWIDRCKEKARDMGVLKCLPGRPKGREDWPCFTGVDLAIKKGEGNDFTAFFTFIVHPSGLRQILDIDIGQYDGPTTVRKVIEKCKAYDSVAIVENNAAQDYIYQFVLEKDAGVPVKTFTTSANAKANPVAGVESLFVEIHNAAWLIPNDDYGRCTKPVQDFIDACLNYTPEDHTADILMAAFFARWQARDWGVLTPDNPDNDVNAIIASVSMR